MFLGRTITVLHGGYNDWKIRNYPESRLAVAKIHIMYSPVLDFNASSVAILLYEHLIFISPTS